LTIFVSNGAESRVSIEIQAGGRKSKMLISGYISTQPTGYQIGVKQASQTAGKGQPQSRANPQRITLGNTNTA